VSDFRSGKAKGYRVGSLTLPSCRASAEPSRSMGPRVTRPGGLIAGDLHWGGLSSPYIQDTIRYPSVTSSGCQWINGLYSNVFRTEHVLRPPA